MRRYCFTLQVDPSRLEEYRRRHAAVWPDMLAALRAAGWHAYEENEPGRLVADVRSYLGDGATRPSGIVESQRTLAPALALLALLVALALTAPTLRAGLAARSA